MSYVLYKRTIHAQISSCQCETRRDIAKFGHLVWLQPLKQTNMHSTPDMTTKPAAVPVSSSTANVQDSTASFSLAADFIPFARSSPPPSPADYPWRSNARTARDPSPVGELDGDKNRKGGYDRAEKDRFGNQDYSTGRDSGKHANKRRHDQDADQTYGNKKQRLDIPLRKAPWVADIDWDRCRNAAEMCAQQYCNIVYTDVLMATG